MVIRARGGKIRLQKEVPSKGKNFKTLSMQKTNHTALKLILKERLVQFLTFHELFIKYSNRVIVYTRWDYFALMQIYPNWLL